MDTAVGPGLIELGIALVGISLEDTSCAAQVAVNMFLLPVGGKLVDDTGRRLSGPWPLIQNIGPDPPFAHALAQLAAAAGAEFTVQDFDGCIVGMNNITGQHMGLDPLDQWLDQLHGAPTPVHESGIGDIGAHAGEDLVEPVEWEVVVELGDKDVGQQGSGGHAARDRAGWCWGLHHLLADPA